MTEAKHLKFGQLAERRARDFLVRRKLRTVAENYRTKLGELDLVMRDRDTLVFIEVRYRRSSTYGDAVESICADKRLKIIRAAHAFLKEHPHGDRVRFDVVAFDGAPDGTPTWIKNAFEAEW